MGAAPVETLDLSGVLCPMTWVRTRLALEALAPGETLEVVLDPGEPRDSVPRSAAEEGHEVVPAEGDRVRIVRR